MVYSLMCVLSTVYKTNVQSYQRKLIKVRAELANLNHCAVSFLRRAAVNLSWYDSIYYSYTRTIREVCSLS